MRLLLASLPLVFVLMATACGGTDPIAAEGTNVVGLNQAVAEANATAENATAHAEEAASNR